MIYKQFLGTEERPHIGKVMIYAAADTPGEEEVVILQPTPTYQHAAHFMDRVFGEAKKKHKKKLKAFTQNIRDYVV